MVSKNVTNYAQIARSSRKDRPGVGVELLQRRTVGAGRDRVPGAKRLADLDDLRHPKSARCEPGRPPVTLEVFDVTTESNDVLVATKRVAEAARPRSFADVLDLADVSADVFDEEVACLGQLHRRWRLQHQINRTPASLP